MIQLGGKGKGNSALYINSHLVRLHSGELVLMIEGLLCKKRLATFWSLAGMSLIKVSLGGNN
jgi:hypothetical protein